MGKNLFKIGRPSRRLSDKLLLAFESACEQGDYETAKDLIRVLELTVWQRPFANIEHRRREMETLVIANEYLWETRILGSPPPAVRAVDWS